MFQKSYHATPCVSFVFRIHIQRTWRLHMMEYILDHGELIGGFTSVVYTPNHF